MTRHLRTALRGVTLVATAALLLTACGGGDGDEKTSDTKADSGSGSLDDVAAATVQITTVGEIRDPEVGATTSAGAGSGFIIDPSGLVVTNNHVVTGAGTVKVRLNETDEEIPAKVLGVSECEDLALLQLTEGDDYPTLPWYKGEVKPALEVYTAGFPLGDEEYTVTKGVVSKAEADGVWNWASVSEAIEHDAAIQPGNSGGPLVTEQGQVVGVNYAGADFAGTGTEQYFAIGAPMASETIKELTDGDVLSIGVNGTAFADEEAGLAGVWVSGVAPGGIAAEAGIMPGDIITTLNGVPLASGTMEEYCDVLRSTDLDDPISVRVIRFDTEESLEGELNGDEELEVAFSFAQELDSELPTGEGSVAPSSEYIDVTDDTGTIAVSVPENWSDIDTASQDILENGTMSPAILAAPSLADFNSDTGPGMGMFLLTDVGGVPLDDILTGGAEGSGCTETNRSDYSDSAFTGRYVELQCANSLGLLLVANPIDDPSQIVFIVAAALTEADLAAIDQIFATFNIVG